MSADSKSIEVAAVNPSEWSAFVADSPQGGLFVSTEFLQDSGSSATFLLAFRRGRPVAGSIRAARKSRARQWFQHHSLVLSPGEHAMALRGSFAHTTVAGELIRAVVGDGCSGGELSFHPSIIDLRAVNWLFDDLGLPLVWKARFTGYIEVASVKVRGSLSRLLRQASRVEFETFTTARSSDLVEVLAESGIPEVVRDLDWIDETASRLLARGIARVVVARSTSDKRTRAASLVVDWRGTAHVMFGGVSGKSLARRYAGPVHDEFIVRTAADSGLAFVDLMGIEGRPRAEYKSAWTNRLVRWLEGSWGCQ